MVDFFLVETKSIHSTEPVSKFNSSEIDKLARLILDTNGLLRPLILKQTGHETYEVVSGHLEYYAAVRAKEKDARKAEMVNALIIESEEAAAAIQQTQFLEKIFSSTDTSATPSVTPLDDLASGLEDLFNRQLQSMTEKLEVNLKSIANQLPKQTKPIDAFNQLNVVDLTRRFHTVGLKGKTANKVVEQIIAQRPFNDLTDVVHKVKGLSAETMVKLVDALADIIFV
jgi:hypothetical protein